MADPNGSVSEVLTRQAAAERALIGGDAAPLMAVWSKHDPLTMLSAGGQYRSGWEAIDAFFRWLASRFSSGSDFSFDVEASNFGSDLGYSVGFERFNASVEGGPVQRITLRVTHVYRREDGDWKLVHRHGDAVTEEALSTGSAARRAGVKRSRRRWRFRSGR